MSHPNIRVVTGHFDPLLPEHARRLQSLAQTEQLLIVVITNPPSPLLPQKARAELVAALAAVDYVIIGETVDDAQNTTDFIDQVICKSRAS